MGYKQLTNNDRDEIWRLHGKGRNANEISKETGRAYSTVASLLKRTGGVRPVPTRRSERHLTLEEREEISRGLQAKATFIDIARQLKRSPSTVSREVARNGGRDHYRAVRADRAATDRARRPKVAKLAGHYQLRIAVAGKLKLQWSPQQISVWLGRRAPRRCHHAGRARDDLRVALPEQRPARDPRRTVPAHSADATSTPATAPRRTARQEPQHGPHQPPTGRGRRPTRARALGRRPDPRSRHRRAIGTVVECSSRYVFLLDLIDGFPTERVCDLLAQQFAALPPAVVRTLTWDQGTEMSGHQAFTARTGIPVYFCYPQPLAAADEREHQRHAAQLLPQGRRPRSGHPNRP